MNADARARSVRRGTPLLLYHCRLLQACCEPEARQRLEAAVGAELAATLCRALSTDRPLRRRLAV